MISQIPSEAIRKLLSTLHCSFLITDLNELSQISLFGLPVGVS